MILWEGCVHSSVGGLGRRCKSWRSIPYFFFVQKKACYFPDSSFCTDHKGVELTLLERSHRFGALGMESVCHSGRHTTRFNCCALNSPLTPRLLQ